jgi:hypothetical protein
MIMLVGMSVVACGRLVIEDWSRATATSKVPWSWRGQPEDSVVHDMSIVSEDGRNVLHLVSANDSWTIIKDINGGVDITEKPFLEWSWKVISLPDEADSREESIGDYAAGLCVGWLRFPEAVRSRTICYIWDTSAPVGTIVGSKEASTLTLIVVRSGAADLGKWINEQRNVYKDFETIYGAAPKVVKMIAIVISSERTSSMAETWWGPIVFRERIRR